MKFALLTLILMFIGCAGQETPPAEGMAPELNAEESPAGPALEPNVASQTVLTCSKDGAENVIYTAKVYEKPQDCKRDEGKGSVRDCRCELLSEDSSFSNDVIVMATSTEDFCGQVLEDFNSRQSTTIPSTGKVIKALHDASYTCIKS